jgi:hypothetical protein
LVQTSYVGADVCTIVGVALEKQDVDVDTGPLDAVDTGTQLVDLTPGRALDNTKSECIVEHEDGVLYLGLREEAKLVVVAKCSISEKIILKFGSAFIKNFGKERSALCIEVTSRASPWIFTRASLKGTVVYFIYMCVITIHRSNVVASSTPEVPK